MAFKNPEAFSEIISLSVDMIIDLRKMIDAMSSGHRLDADKFQTLADSFMDRFHETDMDWNWFSPYMHMLLVHGGDIIRTLPLAPGILSEVKTYLGPQKL